MDFGCLQTGQRQSAGRFSNGVPGGMPFLGSPMAGSYIQPHFAHFIFFMTVFRKWLILNCLMFDGWVEMTTNQRLNP
jgi:hypothetical protein